MSLIKWFGENTELRVREMDKLVEKLFFALIRFEINGAPLDDEMKKLVTPEILVSLYKISKKQDLAHLICDALDKNGFLCDDTEIKKYFFKERVLAICRYEQIKYEYDNICNVLTEEKIPFIPLKGSVLRDYYPEPWMRTSCDIDVLVHIEDAEHAIEILQNKLKYNNKGIGAHDIQLYSESGVHLELHFSLMEAQRNDVQKKLIKQMNMVWTETELLDGYRYGLKGEFFFLYHLTHMLNHFVGGGCGIRFFLDTWIICHKVIFDKKRFNDFLKRTDLEKFAQAVIRTSNIWFDGLKSDVIANEIKDYILYAGMYGDLKNRIALQKGKNKGKISYIISRIFLPYQELKFQYPFLRKHKILLPFYQIRRWLRLLFKRKVVTASQEMKTYSQVSNDEGKRIARLFSELGL